MLLNNNDTRKCHETTNKAKKSALQLLWYSWNCLILYRCPNHGPTTLVQVSLKWDFHESIEKLPRSDAKEREREVCQKCPSSHLTALALTVFMKASGSQEAFHVPLIVFLPCSTSLFFHSAQTALLYINPFCLFLTLILLFIALSSFRSPALIWFGPLCW